MTERLILRLGETPADPISWAAADGAQLGDIGAAENVADLSLLASRIADTTQIDAVMRGEHVAFRTFDAPPTSSKSKALAAAHLLIEDELGQQTDELHVVADIAGGRGRAFAMSKSMLREWLQAFEAAGVKVDRLVADFACLDATPSTPVIVCDRRRALIATGDQAFAAEPDIAARLLPQINLETAMTIKAYGDREALSRLLGADATPLGPAREADLLKLHAEALDGRMGIANLLSGEFRRPSPPFIRWREARKSAAIAAGLCVAVLAGLAADGFRNARAASAYLAASKKIHEAAFPGSSAKDLGEHARQTLDGGGNAKGFVDLSAKLSAAVTSVDTAAIDRIRYDQARREFQFSVRASTDADIQRLRDALAAQGLKANESGGNRQSGEVWIGEMSAAL